MPEIRLRIKYEISHKKLSTEALPSLEMKRRISNEDKQTCWLNACLQLLLNGLDHSSDTCLDSSLGKELKRIQSQSFINPSKIKQMLQDEIRKSDVLVQDNILRGQQCARDFFIMLTENKHSWLDVYHKFHHVTVQTLTCPNCKRASTFKSSELYQELACPPDGSKLQNYVELAFSSKENVEFMCEDGCQKRGIFKKRLQIVAGDSSSFLIIVLTRGIAQVMDNYNNKVTVSDNLKLTDIDNITCVYEPISVIEHEGNAMSSGETEGHYVCDVKWKNDQNWYNTNDENIPKLIPKQKVTKYGYIILYKRIQPF